MSAASHRQPHAQDAGSANRLPRPSKTFATTAGWRGKPRGAVHAPQHHPPPPLEAGTIAACTGAGRPSALASRAPRRSSEHVTVHVGGQEAFHTPCWQCCFVFRSPWLGLRTLAQVPLTPGKRAVLTSKCGKGGRKEYARRAET